MQRCLAVLASDPAGWCIGFDRVAISRIRRYALGMPTAPFSLSSNKVWSCMPVIGHLKAKARLVSIVM
jgi:hypothetical protein